MSLKKIDPNQFVSNPGERFKTEYIGEKQEDGSFLLVEVGTTDLDALHARDEFANDVNVLYERFCNGDLSALGNVQGTFFDAVNLPRDLRGMYETVKTFEESYHNLPDNVKAELTMEQFVSEAGSERWTEIISKAFPPKESVQAEPAGEEAGRV